MLIGCVCPLVPCSLEMDDDTFIDRWGTFFDKISQLLTGADWQYGVANQQYTHYILECLELCTHVCRILRERIASIDGDETLTSYVHSLDELLECLRTIRNKWLEYKDLLDLDLAISGVAYHVPVVHTGQRGRPRFEVTRGQVEYLASLSFTWSEIATLLGVSRKTLYR